MFFSRDKSENQILNPWRLDSLVDKGELKRIELACDGMMREFGYIKMRSKPGLKFKKIIKRFNFDIRRVFVFKF